MANKHKAAMKPRLAATSLSFSFMIFGMKGRRRNKDTWWVSAASAS